MPRAQDRARSARSRKNGARSATIESRALGALKLASEASCARSAQWECAREAGRFSSSFLVNLTESSRLEIFWEIVRAERKNVVSRKTRLNFSKHKNCKKKLFHLISDPCSIFFEHITYRKMQQQKNRFFKCEIVEWSLNVNLILNYIREMKIAFL